LKAIERQPIHHPDIFLTSCRETLGIKSRMKQLHFFIAVCFLVSAAHPLRAQNSTSVSGFITDPSGASVTGAKVTALNTGTNLTRIVPTDSAGYYAFENIPIGSYKITAESAGFDTATATLSVNTAQKARQDFQLRIGATQEKVEVSSLAPELSPNDASLGNVVDRHTVENTPLYLRNWDDLLRLIPGVQSNRYTDQSGATSAGRTGNFNVHGIHSLQNNFILDGIDNNTFSENVQELSTQASRPSVDNLEEFKVVTAPYSSEYGRSPGAAVVVSTKSGTNQLHLLGYEYLRNSYFDANDFFSNRNGLAKPQNNQNQFGANIGGPILRNKLFGFFNYEGTRIHRGVSRTATVPLPNERIGDFSPAAQATYGVKYPTIVDPATRVPFPSNQIPTALLDPVALRLLALFPQPNIPGKQTNNFIRNAGLVDNNDSYAGRIDWNPSEKDSVFGRYTYSNRYRFIPGNFGGIADGTSTSAWGRQNLFAHSAVVGWTHIFTPTLINEFRVGYVRNASYAEQDPFGLNHTADYIPGVPVNPAVDGGVSQTTFSNFGFIGSPDFLPKSQVPQQFQFVDTISLTHGNHSFKFGVDVRTPMRNIFQDEPGTRGSLSFSGQFTGLSYADALVGYVQGAQLTNVFFVDQRLFMASAFVQDDWKVTPKLTFNLGLRYDFGSPAYEGRNRMANFDPSANNGSGGLVFAKDGSLDDRALVNVNTRNFAPRFGFAYSADSKTVIRGGYGIFYSLFERYGSENQLALNYPNLLNVVVAASNNTTPVFLLRNGFPSSYLDPNQVSVSQVRVRAVNPDDPTPYVQQWSFGVQREIGFGFVAEADYVGTKSTHLDVLSDFNQHFQGTPAPYPNFGYTEYTSPLGTGTYHGLETSLTKRFSNGFSARVNYTWSRALDNAPDELNSNSGAPPNGRNFTAWAWVS
jgi:hypothetical protein